ncbi:DUF296 domain-containing protein [Azorhizobium sp. AG788]|uniref:DUF296 domain-containing protein n=1 Tax=Azorhizobium sp. AG788 TaxID=2183897 RepID=UPI003139E002
MRQLKQPGPVALERIESVAAPLETLDFILKPGLSLNAAIAGPLMDAGFTAAAVSFTDGALAPFEYVMPAPSPDPDHAAWYSAKYAPVGETLITAANVTYGTRDGGPFIHCHAIWHSADGALAGGHILPLESVVSRPTQARAWGTRGATIVARPDPETNFTLFTPEPTPVPEGGQRTLLLARLRPNIDVCAALEEVCRRHNVRHALVRGSLGSLVGAEFDDAAFLPDTATEFLVREGVVTTGPSGELEARLRIAIVGMSGDLREGWLTRGQNGVCITCEFALEAISA